MLIDKNRVSALMVEKQELAEKFRKEKEDARIEKIQKQKEFGLQKKKNTELNKEIVALRKASSFSPLTPLVLSSAIESPTPLEVFPEKPSSIPSSIPSKQVQPSLISPVQVQSSEFQMQLLQQQMLQQQVQNEQLMLQMRQMQQMQQMQFQVSGAHIGPHQGYHQGHLATFPNVSNRPSFQHHAAQVTMWLYCFHMCQS